MLQGFSNTVERIGRDTIVSNATEVVFGVCCVLGDRVGLDVGCKRDRGGNRFLGKGERLVDGFGGGDSGVDCVRHDE